MEKAIVKNNGQEFLTLETETHKAIYNFGLNQENEEKIAGELGLIPGEKEKDSLQRLIDAGYWLKNLPAPASLRRAIARKSGNIAVSYRNEKTGELAEDGIPFITVKSKVIDEQFTIYTFPAAYVRGIENLLSANRRRKQALPITRTSGESVQSRFSKLNPGETLPDEPVKTELTLSSAKKALEKMQKKNTELTQKIASIQEKLQSLRDKAKTKEQKQFISLVETLFD